MSQVNSRRTFRRETVRIAAAVTLLLAETLTPVRLGSHQSDGQNTAEPSPPQSATPPAAREYYILARVVAEGMSGDDEKKLAGFFLEEATSPSSQLASRIDQTLSEFGVIRNCGKNPFCEVISIQIKKEPGEFSYEITSKLINTPGPPRHPGIAGTRTCSINTADIGEEPVKVCHRKFLHWYADQLISHDRVYHGVN